jgi:hypothetical protein
MLPCCAARRCEALRCIKEYLITGILLSCLVIAFTMHSLIVKCSLGWAGELVSGLDIRLYLPQEAENR